MNSNEAATQIVLDRKRLEGYPNALQRLHDCFSHIPIEDIPSGPTVLSFQGKPVALLIPWEICKDIVLVLSQLKQATQSDL